MDVDVEMGGNEVEFTFTAVEIDLDYEFEAARWFDFSREESVAEVRDAEMWFQTAGSYPPSPFALKFVPRGILLESSNITSIYEGVENNMFEEASNIERAPDVLAMSLTNQDYNGISKGISSDFRSCNTQTFYNQPHNLTTGLTFYDCPKTDKIKSKAKSTLRPSLARTSTLMKPTASQLAKQNRLHHVDESRFQKQENYNASVNEIQATKRQKLEGGHLRKVVDANPQQTNLFHKAPTVGIKTDGNLPPGRLRLTIPREPELETANRARILRPKSSRESEQVQPTAPSFRALPLNRKIFNAPSTLLPKRSTPQLPEFQEFHLKTSERAMQQNTASSSSSSYNPKVIRKPSVAPQVDSAYRESRRPPVTDSVKHADSEVKHQFKALPLNKKIFSSKGDIGVFRNSKRETTVPMEFNFQTEKRAQHDPPIELFNKLSLATNLQQNLGYQCKVPPATFSKGSKENRSCSFKQESEVKLLATEKLPRFWAKQSQSTTEKVTSEAAPPSKV